MIEQEEYIEQAYFWRIMRERIHDGVPAQEILIQVKQEVLSTTKLPMAIDFMLGEIKHKGQLCQAMALMPHYFAPFQAFIMARAEADKSRFDMTIACQILEFEAAYRASTAILPAGLFLYQFECIARNRLGYEDGMRAMVQDPTFDALWREWITRLRMQLGASELSELIYARSEFAIEEKRRAERDPLWEPKWIPLFGSREGRIAKANIGKDPLYMFAALQRHMGYPTVPKPKPPSEERIIHPVIEQRFQLLEKRLLIVEQEAKGGLDISAFYVPPNPAAAFVSKPDSD